MSLKRNLHFNSHMGRMGNQMFQYACAKNLAIEHGFTTSMSHLDKLEYFKLTPMERIINKIKSTLFFRLAKPLFGMKVMNTDLKCMERLYLDDLHQIQEPTMIWGFFQSLKYFHNSQETIKKHFEIKPEYYSAFELFLKENNLQKGKYLVIHLRLTDYKGFTVPCLKGDDFTLPLSYYKNAMQSLKSLVNVDLPFVFVSDDPDSIDGSFPDLDSKIISRGDVITDFLVLQNSAHMIISNSTFAWWSAYLNPNPGAQIFCPKYFLGFKEDKETPIDIYPSEWNKVSVF